jgi:hypothetical protein
MFRIDVSVNPRQLSPLPSTQSDAIQHSPPLPDSFSPIPTNPISISETSRKRKRQSSDSDSDSDQGQTKRAHHIPSSPSNSLMEPLPSVPSNFVDLDQWIKSLGGEGIDLGHSIPEPVYETCSPTAAVEIDSYRYASSSPSSSVSSLGPSTPPDYTTSGKLYPQSNWIPTHLASQIPLLHHTSLFLGPNHLYRRCKITMARQISPRNYYQRIGPRKVCCLIWIHPAVSRPHYAFFSVLQLTVISFRRGLRFPKLGFGIDSCDFSQRLFHLTNASRSS